MFKFFHYKLEEGKKNQVDLEALIQILDHSYAACPLRSNTRAIWKNLLVWEHLLIINTVLHQMSRVRVLTWITLAQADTSRGQKPRGST